MMPAFINVPTAHRGAYRPATVLAAIPLGRPDTYAVVAIDPDSLMARPTYIAAETSRAQTDAPWFTNKTHPSDTLSGAIGDMITLASNSQPSQ